MISLIINTCAGSKDPRTLERVGSFGLSYCMPYGERAAGLRKMIERYRTVPGIDLIVSGEWECGDGYRYVHCPGPTRTPMDPPAQRQAGAIIANYELMVFLNDDHFVPPEHLDSIWERMREADVGAFVKRLALKKDSSEQKLETGWPEYVMGHACVMSRKALEVVPWDVVPLVVQQDVEHTKLVRAAGLRIMPLIVPIYDIEVGGFPDA